MWQKDWRDADVVVDYLPFCEAGFWIEYLVEIRYLNLTIFDDQLRFLRHVENVAQVFNLRRQVTNLPHVTK